MAFIEARDLKLFLIIVFAGTFIALGITLAVMLPKRMEQKAAAEEQQKFVNLQNSAISIPELAIPPDFKNVWQETWYPYRGMTPIWSKEQAKKYLKDPEKLTEEILKKENERKIEDLFKTVP